MKNNTMAAVTLLMVAVIGAVVLNFPEFLMGSPANAKNLIVTLAYIAIGILVLRISAKCRDRKVLRAMIAVCSATLLFALLTTYVNITAASVDWALPFVIVLLGPWYGITLFTDSFLTASVVIALVSFGLSTTAIILLNRTKCD